MPHEASLEPPACGASTGLDELSGWESHASAQTMMHQGADVLLQTTDSRSVLQAAKRSKFALGAFSDRSQVAPRAHRGSAVIDWAPYYRKAV